MLIIIEIINMKVAIMLPTYNEAENIENLIRSIQKINPEYEIVVVDDNSPDGTGEILEGLKNSNNNLHVIHRKGERGRGSAGVIGFKECLKIEPDVIVEMDADFSHKPEFIPELLRRIEDADIVIASRYVNGGKDGRNILRRTISKLANIYTKTICGIKIYDATSGFRAFRASILKRINLDEINSSGPSIVQEVLLNCIKEGANVVEVPYFFENRKKGKSKLSLLLLLETFFNITKMGLKFRTHLSSN